MRWLDHRDAVPESLRGAIIALGNFDGFHLGHQAVADEAIQWAKKAGRPSIVATFEPHPMRYFRPDTEPFRLTTMEQRQEAFLAAGATAMLVFHFDQDLAETSPEDFVHNLLADRLGVVGLVTGEDFTFGKGRAGNRHVLESLGRKSGIETRVVAPVMDGGKPVSSSRVRAALCAGDPEEAARLLTRPFAIRGVVEHGDKRGRVIGYPTANLSIERYLRPKFGVYAVTGRLLASDAMLKGVANIGIRPQFEPPKELLEPYFFDFSGNLYGQEIEVAFHHFLRPEERFGSLEQLTAQIEKDCGLARELLSAPPQ